MLHLSMSGMMYHSRSAKAATRVFVQDQTVSFGALTPAGGGGAELRAVDGSRIAVTGVASVVSGDGAGWTAAGGRLVRTTATPASSNGAVLRVTHAGGTANVTLSVDPWTYDITDTPEFMAAQLDMNGRKAEPGATTAAWVMRLRDGVELVELPGNIAVELFPGPETESLNWLTSPGVADEDVIWWPNRHAKTDAEYDYNAVAYFQGGHLTIKSETPLGAAFRACLNNQGGTRLHISGLRFEHTSQPADGMFRTVDFNNVEVEIPTTPFITQMTGRAVASVSYGHFLYSNCRFGGYGVVYDDGVTPVADYHWLDIGGLGRYRFGTSVFQDCFAYGYRDPMLAWGLIAVIIRCVSRQRIVDFFKGDSSVFAEDVKRSECVANFDYDLNNNALFAGDHSDFYQSGSDKAIGGFDHFVSRNIVDCTTSNSERSVFLYDHPAKGITAGDTAVARGSQGMLCTPHSNTAPNSGLVSRNIIITTAPHGYTFGSVSSNMLFEHNLLVPTTGEQTDETLYQITPTVFSIGGAERLSVYNDGRDAANTSYSRVRNNIAQAFNLGLNAGFEADNFELDPKWTELGFTKPRDPGALAAVFNGPFTPGVGGDKYSYRTDSYANAWADLTAIFTPKAGSGMEAAGILAPLATFDITPPALVSLSPANGGTVPTLAGFEITFDRAMVPGPGATTLYKADGTLVEVLNGFWNRDGFRTADFQGASVALIPDTLLVEGDSYYIVVEPDALLTAEGLVPSTGVAAGAWSFTAGAAPAFNPAAYFAANPGLVGMAYDPSNLATLWKDEAGTIPVTADGDLVARIDDLSGNGRHALMPVEAERPIWRTDGAQRWLDLTGPRHVLMPVLGKDTDWEFTLGYEKGVETASALLSITPFSLVGRYREPVVGVPNLSSLDNWATVSTMFSDARGMGRLYREKIYEALAAREVSTMRFGTRDGDGVAINDWNTFKARIGKVGTADDSMQGRLYGVIAARTLALPTTDRLAMARWLRRLMDAVVVPGVSILASEFGPQPLPTGIAQTTAATGVRVDATATGASIVVTAAISVTLNGIGGAAEITWLPDATGVEEPLTIDLWAGDGRRFRPTVAHLNAPTQGAGKIIVRQPDDSGGYMNTYPSTVSVHHLSMAVVAGGTGVFDTTTSVTEGSVAFTPPAGRSITFAVAAVGSDGSTEKLLTDTGAGTVVLNHSTGVNGIANGTTRHWTMAEDVGGAATSIGVSWTGGAGMQMALATLVAV